jgi:hypothetical protein
MLPKSVIAQSGWWGRGRLLSHEIQEIGDREAGTLARGFHIGGVAVTHGYDTSTPVLLPAQPSDRRTNMTYDTAGRHTGPVAASPPPPEPDGDEPIVVTRSD